MMCPVVWTCRGAMAQDLQASIRAQSGRPLSRWRLSWTCVWVGVQLRIAARTP